MRLRAAAIVIAIACVASAPLSAQPQAARFEGRLVQEGSGAPVADASISIVGITGTARTDKDGRFTWAPAPQPPFQAIVVLSGGQVARPILVETLQQGTTVIHVKALSDEAVTVARGTRIAQLVFQRVEEVDLVTVDTLPPSDRGSGGFGSTGA